MKSGSKSNFFVVLDHSCAFDLCRELNRPIYVRIQETGQFGKVYPSGRWEEK